MESKYLQKYYKYKKKYLNFKKNIGGASLAVAVAEEPSDDINLSQYNTYDVTTDKGWVILSSLPDDNARLNLVQNTIINGDRATEILKNFQKYKNKEIPIPPTILFYLAYKTSEFDGEFGYNFPYLGSHELEIIKDAIRNDTSDKKIVITPSGIGRLVFDILVCTKNINVVIIDIDQEQTKVFLAKFMDFRKNNFPLNKNIKVVTRDVLKLNERELNYISNADIIAVPNLIHFFDKDKLNIFKSLIDSNLKVNGRLYLFWQPIHSPNQNHSIEQILMMFNNFSLIDRKRLYHLMRKIPNVVAWMRGVEDVPPGVKVGPPDKGPINVSLILEKNR